MEFNQANFAVGTTIKQKRKEFSVKQKDIADAIGISRAQLSNIEAGRCGASVEHLYKIASYLCLTIHDLIPVSGKPKIRIKFTPPKPSKHSIK